MIAELLIIIYEQGLIIQQQEAELLEADQIISDLIEQQECSVDIDINGFIEALTDSL